MTHCGRAEPPFGVVEFVDIYDPGAAPHHCDALGQAPGLDVTQDDERRRHHGSPTTHTRAHALTGQAQAAVQHPEPG